MSTICMSQSALMADSAYAARRSSCYASSQPSHHAFERRDSKPAMCTMHMANKTSQTMDAAMFMSMAAAGIIIVRTDVATSVSLCAAGLTSTAFVVLFVLFVVSLLLVSLVVLISLITLLLTCLTGRTTLESLVGQIERVIELASIGTHSTQGD